MTVTLEIRLGLECQYGSRLEASEPLPASPTAAAHWRQYAGGLGLCHLGAGGKQRQLRMLLVRSPGRMGPRAALAAPGGVVARASSRD